MWAKFTKVHQHRNDNATTTNASSCAETAKNDQAAEAPYDVIDSMRDDVTLHDSLIDNIDFLFAADGDGFQKNKEKTFSFEDFVGLMLTTSCASVWSQAGETNRAAKLVPALPLSTPGHGDESVRQRLSSASMWLPNDESVRVFVFDDKINLHQGGSENTKGCCNLRDIHTGKFVDFSVGQNGFARDKLFSHTLVHHSSDYKNVLVQVSILDVMTNPDYFSAILKKYAKPTESLIVYVEVYGTLIWDRMFDGPTCYDFGLSQILLCSMFRYLEVRPASRGPASFRWESQPATTLEAESLLNLVKRTSQKDGTFYQQFWTFKTCKRFLEAVASVAEIGWQDQESTITTNQFFMEYSQHIDAMRRSSAGAGMADSWLRCYDRLTEEGHAVVVNSFQPEAQKVLRHLVSDPTQVPQFVVNYSLWSQHEIDLLTSNFAR